MESSRAIAHSVDMDRSVPLQMVSFSLGPSIHHGEDWSFPDNMRHTVLALINHKAFYTCCKDKILTT